jgi:hypothetical protein
MNDPLSRLLAVELGTVPRLQPRALWRSAGGKTGADATPGIIEEHVEREWSNGTPTGVVQTRRIDGRTHQPIESSRPLDSARVPSATVAFTPPSELNPRGPLGAPSALQPPTAPNAGALDAGALDAGALDAGALDAGALDAGVPNAGVLGTVALGIGAPGAAAPSLEGAPSLRRDRLPGGAGVPLERSTAQAPRSKPFGAGSPSASAPVGAVERFADGPSAAAPGDAPALASAAPVPPLLSQRASALEQVGGSDTQGTSFRDVSSGRAAFSSAPRPIGAAEPWTRPVESGAPDVTRALVAPPSEGPSPAASRDERAPSAAAWASPFVVDALLSGAQAPFAASHGAPSASAPNATLHAAPESGGLVDAISPAGTVSVSAGVPRITARAGAPAPNPAPFQLGAGGLAEAIHALAASAGALPPANAAPASASRASAAPVVRVRIGRIDIHAPMATASSEPSAPRAEPVRAGLSLDALLRLREES